MNLQYCYASRCNVCQQKVDMPNEKDNFLFLWRMKQQGYLISLFGHSIFKALGKQTPAITCHRCHSDRCQC